MRKRLLSWKIAWSACQFSTVTRRVLPGDEAPQSTCEEKPQGASGCWEPWKRKEGQAECRAFGKVQTMKEERGWPETTPELPGTAAGLPGSSSLLPSLSSRYCKVSLADSHHCDATQMSSHSGLLMSHSTPRGRRYPALVNLLRIRDGPLSQMHTTLQLTLTSSMPSPDTAPLGSTPAVLPPSSAFCILFLG